MRFSLLCLSMFLFASVTSYASNLDQITTIADQFESEYFAASPETSLLSGRAEPVLSRFDDHSWIAYQDFELRKDEFLHRLQQIDPQTLKGTPQYITYRLLKDTLEHSKASRICNEPLWKVSPLDGWHVVSTQIAELQPVGTPEYREFALKRWATFSQVVQDEINKLKTGAEQGYTAPKAAVNAVLKQVHYLINSPIESSPYFDMASRDDDLVFQAEIKNLIKTVINPSLAQYATYLHDEYLPIARNAIGVSALPHGEACYQAKIQENTTLNIAAQDIHDFGRQHMDTLKKEVGDIGRELFGIESMAQVYELAMRAPQYLFHSEQEILDYNLAALARVQAKAADWFGTTPKTPGVIKPYPEYRAKSGAAGEYSPPSEDGSRPGIFYINTYAPEQQSQIGHEATLFHELIPGHHFQIALHYENKTHHSMDKYLWNSGFGEGWALYVERLADEMGLYSDNIAKLGMLSNESLRTARLVVDTGIHVMNWTRDDAIEYMKQHTSLSLGIIEGEVDRYIMLPGQATAYMLGKREIDTLKAEAKARLKHDFDIKEFHDHVLENGSVSLPLLRELIYQWLAPAMKP